MIDGAGAQSLVLLRWYDNENISLANFLWRDDWGLRDTEGTWSSMASPARPAVTPDCCPGAPLRRVCHSGSAGPARNLSGGGKATEVAASAD